MPAPWITMSVARVFAVSVVVSLLTSEALAATPVAISGSPAAPVPAVDGTGLCSATVPLSIPSLPQSTSTFVSGMNAAFEASETAPVTSVHRGPLDFSNNLNNGSIASYGDFLNAACGNVGGCAFAINDTTSTFGVRLRGFVRVGSAMVNQPIHFGVYTDDATSLNVFDGAGQSHAVIVRPPQLGAPTWRSTNTVTFASEGLYPIELLYAQITEHAALEVSTYQGMFADFERPANQPPVVSLSGASYTLLAPSQLFQSEDGAPAFEDLDTCQQCDRQYAGKPGHEGCAEGYRCNAAALCSRCSSSTACGPSCSPCEAGATCAPADGGFACVAAPPVEPDAGTTSPQTDASTPPPSVEVDAGATPSAPPPADEGCGCRTSGPSGPTSAGAVVFGLLLSAWSRRRRRGR